MNSKLNEIILNPVRYYSRLLKSGVKGIDLTMGEGHFASPFTAKLKAYEALTRNNTKYSSLDGDDILKKLLIEKYYPYYSEKNEIIITSGSTQGMFGVIFSLVNSSSDEIIIVSPHYPAYENVIKLFGAKCVIIDTAENNFKLNNKLLEEAITDHTKAIIINEPCNPTGITYTQEEKEDLIKVFSQHNFYIIMDELYRLFTPRDFVSFHDLIMNKYNELKNRFIFINGLSKSHMMTGYRIGYVVSNSDINTLLRKVNYLSISCVSTVMQQAAIGALNEESYCQFVKRYYLNNASILRETLDDLNINYVNADSGYYIFVDISSFEENCEAFCQFMLNEYNVALVPGTLFGEEYTNYIRVSCCKDIKDIVDFIKIITNLTKKFDIKNN